MLHQRQQSVNPNVVRNQAANRLQDQHFTVQTFRAANGSQMDYTICQLRPVCYLFQILNLHTQLVLNLAFTSAKYKEQGQQVHTSR